MNSRLIYLFFVMLFIACTPPPEKLPSGENKLSPAIVDNPATANGKSDTSKTPKFYFAETSHHFGEMKAGAVVSYVFKFKNTGGSQLVIAQATGSCGCTVPEYSKNPVPPGGEGEVKVTFDSHGKSGMESKTVTILANTIPATKVLTISAEVLQPVKK
ncbi:MAG: DUF1573 domain-containing protein [Bacteroidia bacterium]